MSALRKGAPGTTRTCPHCKATILESATVCPGCRGHLRYDPDAIQGTSTAMVPLHVEGTVRHPGDGAWEYSMVLTIRNERGEEIARHVVGVGAMSGSEERTFSLKVEAVEAAGHKRGRTRH